MHDVRNLLVLTSLSWGGHYTKQIIVSPVQNSIHATWGAVHTTPRYEMNQKEIPKHAYTLSINLELQGDSS